MMRGLIVGAVMCGLLAGCAMTSTPVSFAESKPVPIERLVAHYKQESGTYPVQIKRDVPFGLACMYELDVDGEKSAFLNEGEKLTFFLPAGQHVLTMTIVAPDDLKPGFRCGADPMEYPLLVETNRPNRYRFYESEQRMVHFSPTATE